MSKFTLVISCLTTSNLPWFMDLIFQVPMQYCSLQHQTLLLSPVKSTAGYCICFGSITWNAKVGSQETPGVTGKFGLGIQNEGGQRLIEFCQENKTLSSNNTREDSTHGHYQMVNTKIRLIIFFAAKDGEALYSQQNKTGLRSWTPYCQIQT